MLRRVPNTQSELPLLTWCTSAQMMLVPTTRLVPLVVATPSSSVAFVTVRLAGRFPIGVGGNSEASDRRAIEIEGRAVIVDHVDGNTNTGVRAPIVSEFLAEVVGDMVVGVRCCRVMESACRVRGTADVSNPYSPPMFPAAPSKTQPGCVLKL
jgi:hypothetical protein